MEASEKMLQALANEDLAEAQLQLQEALRSDPPELLAALAEELLGLGFLTEAQEILLRLLKKQPAKQELNILLAEIAIENDQTDRAFEYLERVEPTHESYPESLIVLADLYQLLGIPEVSEAKLKEAQTLLPEEPILEFALAELYFSVDRFAEAIASYQKLLVQGATELSGISLNERIGTALSMAGEFEESLAYLEAAVAQGATDDRLFQLAFTYLQIEENQKAIHYLEQLRAVNPQYQALYLYLAEALQGEEQLVEAQEVIEAGIKENPFQVELLHFAAENAFRLHDTASAEKFLLAALELPDKQDETLLTLSNLYLNEERFDEVVAVIQRMEESGNPYAEWNLAQAYYALEEYQNAAVHYEEAFQSLNHEADFLKEYGLFLREEGRTAEARELLQHYLQHEPGDLEAASLLEDLTGGDQDVY